MLPQTRQIANTVAQLSTDEDPTLRIESSAIINLRGVSTKLNKYIVFTMQTYKKLSSIKLSYYNRNNTYKAVYVCRGSNKICNPSSLTTMHR